MAWTVGALALLLVVAGSVWMTQPVFLVGSRAKEGPAPDPARLESRVHELVVRFHPRDSGHPENLSRAARFIAEDLRRSGAAVLEQTFEAAGATYANVIAAIGPDTRDVVVVGAHYDVAGEKPGADDNASGVAGLLELADLLAGAKLSCRVELVAYAAEMLSPSGVSCPEISPHSGARTGRLSISGGAILRARSGCSIDRADRGGSSRS